MALNMDPKFGQQAAETIVVLLNGEAREVVVDAYQLARTVGEDNPAVEHLDKMFKDYEVFFNDQMMPAVNKIKDNFLANSDLATYFNNLDFANVQAAEEVGTVEDANYDAAKDL